MKDTEITESSHLAIAEKEIIFRLWNKEYPEKLCFKTIPDLENYLVTLANAEYYFLKNTAGEIEGWAITFMRENEKWFTLTVSIEAQGRGKGTSLLDKLKENSENLNGWVIDHNNDVKQNGEPYKSPLVFYQKNNFLICTEIRLEIPVLSAVKITWCRE